MKPSTRSERPQSFEPPLRLDRGQQLTHRLGGPALGQLLARLGLAGRLGRHRVIRQGGASLVSHRRRIVAALRCPDSDQYAARPRANMFSLHAFQGPGETRRVAGDGTRGRVTVSGRRGPDPELRRRQARGREARPAPPVEACPGDQDQPGLAADPRQAPRARAGQEARDGRPAAARPAPVPAARPQAPVEGGRARRGNDQGRSTARQGGRPGGDPRDRLRPLRLGRRQPERRAGRQGRRLLGPRVRAADRGGQDRRPTPSSRRPFTRSRSCAST